MTMIHQKSSDGGDFPMDNNLVPYQTLRPWLRQVKMLPIMPPTVLWLWPIGISENALWRNNRMVQSLQNMGSDWFQSCPMNWQRSSVKAILSVISIITVDFISIYLMPRFCTRVCKILIGRICARYCVFMMKMLAFDIWMKLSMRASVRVPWIAISALSITIAFCNRRKRKPWLRRWKRKQLNRSTSLSF